jgi:glycosyltransferase involved in cell wall biosynthesis
MALPFLSVIVPVYNEAATAEALAPWDGRPGVRVLTLPANRGKGAAVRTGLAQARGTVAIIQDADLEYDPDDYPLLVEPIRRGKVDVVYGSRYLYPQPSLPWSRYRLAVVLLNGMVRLLFGQRLTDEATCYKAFRTSLLRALDLRAERFELCAEMTAKFCRLGIPIVEVPITYRPRSVAEGKKIRFRDAWQTVWTLLRWRFARLDGPAVSLARSRRPGVSFSAPASAGRLVQS